MTVTAWVLFSGPSVFGHTTRLCEILESHLNSECDHLSDVAREKRREKGQTQIVGVLAAAGFWYFLHEQIATGALSICIILILGFFFVIAQIVDLQGDVLFSAFSRTRSQLESMPTVYDENGLPEPNWNPRPLKKTGVVATLVPIAFYAILIGGIWWVSR